MTVMKMESERGSPWKAPLFMAMEFEDEEGSDLPLSQIGVELDTQDVNILGLGSTKVVQGKRDQAIGN